MFRRDLPWDLLAGWRAYTQGTGKTNATTCMLRTLGTRGMENGRAHFRCSLCTGNNVRDCCSVSSLIFPGDSDVAYQRRVHGGRVTWSTRVTWSRGSSATRGTNGPAVYTLVSKGFPFCWVVNDFGLVWRGCTGGGPCLSQG